MDFIDKILNAASNLFGLYLDEDDIDKKIDIDDSLKKE